MFIININNNKYKLFKNISIYNFLNKKNLLNKNEDIAVCINNKIKDINTIINKDCEVKILKIHQSISHNILSRSCLYILGMCIRKIFLNSKLVLPKIEKDFFYYDFYFNKKISIKKIKLIEKLMNYISYKKINIYNKKINFLNLKNLFYKNNQKYRIVNVNKNIDNKYNIYLCNNHFDFCNGVNVYNTKFIKNIFTIDKNIYQTWGKNKINKILYRIYGKITNINKKYILNKNNNEDHRDINKNNNLYLIEKESPGMIFWNKNGMIIFNELKKFIKEKINKKNEYDEISTPMLMKKDVWEKTNHINFYEKNMYNLNIDKKSYCIKPMNCPAHIKIFNKNITSYKNLPYRTLEFGNCYRYELSGSLYGLMRTRSFTQDDTHIFCSKKEIKKEILNSIKLMYDVYSAFNFKNIKIKLSTRPNNKIGNDKVWNYSEKLFINILKKNNIIFEIDKGGGAFYGPKIEFLLYDLNNKMWQCGTIQIDFFLSEKLNATYIDYNNKKKNPIIIHRAILGSIERFIGIITDNYLGKYPLWLSPIQVVIISITCKEINYVKKIFNTLIKKNIRVKIDIENKTLNYKIRFHTKNNIPYIIICGKKEVKNKNLYVRNYNINIENINIKNFLKIIKKEIKEKKNINNTNEIY